MYAALPSEDLNAGVFPALQYEIVRVTDGSFAIRASSAKGNGRFGVRRQGAAGDSGTGRTRSRHGLCGQSRLELLHLPRR